MTGETAQSVNEMIELAGKDAAENYTTLWGAPQWIEDSEGDMGKFKEAFQAEFPDAKPEHFNFLTLWAYSDVFVIAEALKQTNGDTDKQKVVDALDKISNFQAGEGSDFPYGFKVGLPRTFTADDHEGTKTLTPLIIKGGKFEVLEEGQ
jgi:branched-chain amino acid transport system substrate-binding protein